MSSPSYRPHYTVSDYELWQGDWELWQGVPVAMSPSPTPRHQQVAFAWARKLAEALERTVCPDCQVLQETDWQVAQDTVVRPDVIIHCGPLPAVRIETPPRLILEVLSPATARNDHLFKRELYASQGVPYYLLADPDTGELQILHLTGSKYESFSGAPPYGFQLTDDCAIQVEVPG
jgi:Uma2 family endonuclease